MSRPIVVTLPHQLGKAEALRRLQTVFSNAQSSGGSLLFFKSSGQATTWIFARASLDKHERDRGCRRRSVRLEVQLPWFLSMLANKAKALWKSRGS